MCFGTLFAVIANVMLLYLKAKKQLKNYGI